MIDFWALHDTTATAELLCSTLENSCDSVWASHNFTSQADCLAEYAMLPRLSGTYHFDGKDRSCRTLHSSFAANNPTHCPHISFNAMVDSTGVTKCQVSDMVPMESPFTAAEWSAFETFGINNGLPTGFALATAPSPSPAPTFMGACTHARIAMAAATVALVAVWTSVA